MPVDGQPTAFLIGQADPPAQMRAEDAVLFDQIRDGLLLLVGPPAGHRHDEESKRSNIHDRGSLHQRLKSLSDASAEKWDTTAVLRHQPSPHSVKESDTSTLPDRVFGSHRQDRRPTSSGRRSCGTFRDRVPSQSRSPFAIVGDWPPIPFDVIRRPPSALGRARLGRACRHPRKSSGVAHNTFARSAITGQLRGPRRALHRSKAIRLFLQRGLEFVERRDGLLHLEQHVAK